MEVCFFFSLSFSLPSLRRVFLVLGLSGCFLAVGLAAEGEQKEAASKSTPADEARQRQRELALKVSEREFTDRDLNGNLRIDEEEWIAILDEQRGLATSGTVSREKLTAIDANKDGSMDDPEIDAWNRVRFEKKFAVYLQSEIYHSRLANQDQTKEKTDEDEK